MNSNDKKNALISLAKKQPKQQFQKQKMSHLEEIRQFIDDNKIASHESSTIPAATIYFKYNHWCNINGIKPRRPNEFFKQFKHYFNKKPTGLNTYYYLHPEGWDLTLESQQYANEEYKKLYATKGKKSKVR